jgi:hypothetical protein
MGRGVGNIINQASVVKLKDIRPWQPRSSFRMRCSLVGCNYSSEGHSLSRGCSVALTAQRSSDRVQRSSQGCSVAHKGAA